MVTLDHSSIAVSFATFDDFRHFGINFKNKLLPVSILDWPDSDVLQGNDAFRDILGRVLEVVKTPVVKNEPTPLPSFPASALQQKQIDVTFVAFFQVISLVPHVFRNCKEMTIMKFVMPSRISTASLRTRERGEHF